MYYLFLFAWVVCLILFILYTFFLIEQNKLNQIKLTNHVWSTVPIWGGTSRSHGLDLQDRVQKRVVSLVGSGLSAELQCC